MFRDIALTRLELRVLLHKALHVLYGHLGAIRPLGGQQVVRLLVLAQQALHCLGKISVVGESMPLEKFILLCIHDNFTRAFFRGFPNGDAVILHADEFVHHRLVSPLH